MKKVIVDQRVYLAWVPETIFTLSDDGAIVTYERADSGDVADTEGAVK